MRKIIHLDMDCFFAAVEMRDNPELRHQPIAVGGSQDRRGVISTCNYLARQYGVRSAMASAYALRLCPELILVPGRMSVYKEVSQQIRSIFLQYTDKVEPLSLDEAYLDVTDASHCQGSATLMATEIRSQIVKQTGLTASAGIAPLKFLAKVASDLNKPNGQFVITPDEVDDFVKQLPLTKIPGVGKVTANKLEQLGLLTCGDVQAFEKHQLVQLFGKFGHSLYQRACGIDEREICADRIRKSVGVETTLGQDIHSSRQCQQILAKLIPELDRRIQASASDRTIVKQVVKLKFSDFIQTTIEHRQETLSVNLFYELLEQALKRAQGRGIRLVGVAVGLGEKQVDHAPAALQLDLGL
ncbi:DNA polymerase IV [Shewanella sp. NIFS-20-20]|uniref:DNA polymerase IV n=1 Tax=Shewanella sp. NIFS-20-20 TaxID=2853806 RepID=UPI001C44169E|nr:DNA polymerase IV [Shewanella sp. NIFS-20-20]MBV7317076.1 DNA polymerase IV [Shewanella sp. NIFS-20-20]